MLINKKELVDQLIKLITEELKCYGISDEVINYSISNAYFQIMKEVVD